MPSQFDLELEFDWDTGNLDKNQLKHQVNQKEAEEAFLDPTGLRSKDPIHSRVEDRWLLLGQTSQNRQLAIFFTLRKMKIRVVSARPMSRKERHKYENQKI